MWSLRGERRLGDKRSTIRWGGRGEGGGAERTLIFEPCNRNLHGFTHFSATKNRIMFLKKMDMLSELTSVGGGYVFSSG